MHTDGRTARRCEFHDRLLDAAEALVRENGDVSFATRALAARAGVSPATPFNHFGSKKGVLSGIIARTLTQLAERLSASPRNPDAIERIFAAGDAVTSLYADDPALFRPVFGELLGSGQSEPGQLVAQANASWLKGLRAARADGRIQSGRSLEVVASQLEVHWIGALAGWIAGAFDKTAWLCRVQYGTALVLTNVATDAERPRLRRRTLAIEKRLSVTRAGYSRDV